MFFDRKIQPKKKIQFDWNNWSENSKNHVSPSQIKKKRALYESTQLNYLQFNMINNTTESKFNENIPIIIENYYASGWYIYNKIDALVYVVIAIICNRFLWLKLDAFSRNWRYCNVIHLYYMNHLSIFEHRTWILSFYFAFRLPFSFSFSSSFTAQCSKFKHVHDYYHVEQGIWCFVELKIHPQKRMNRLSI